MAWMRNHRSRLLRLGRGRPKPSASLVDAPPPATAFTTLSLDIADALVVHLQAFPGMVEVGKLDLESPLMSEMRARGIELVVPMVSQGSVIGLLALGPRRSRQPYSAGDRAFVTSLAAQAAPAIRVGQMVRQQQVEAQERERIEQELRVAQLIQQTLLPQALPELPGWQVATVYRPARVIGGDFYDFIMLNDGRLGIIIADVTSKGVPAALVMATTRSVLRTAAMLLDSPGRTLIRANELLCPDMPPNMFVTCLYAILDPATGRLSYANAGHPLPLRRRVGGLDELRVTGLPLGLMPDARYEDRETTVAPGETVLFYSDGLIEAHDREQAMLGVPRLQQIMTSYPEGSSGMIEHVINNFMRLTGTDWEAEDDVTIVTLQRAVTSSRLTVSVRGSDERASEVAEEEEWRTLDEWSMANEPGNERLAMERATAALRPFGLSSQRIERLRTAIAEATLNAMEHGNQYRADSHVRLEVRMSKRAVMVNISDQGGGADIMNLESPSIEAKLMSRQSPRGWGMLLIKQMVDEVSSINEGSRHTVQLVLHLEGACNADQPA